MNSQTLVQELKKRLADFTPDTNLEEVGTVVSVGDGIVSVSGLENVMVSEIVLFADNTKGVALNLDEGMVGVIVVGDYGGIKEGQLVKRSGQTLSVPVGDKIIGRIVDPLARPIDDKGEIKTDKEQLLDKKAPGVMEREPVNQPLQTGIMAIDAMIPIGRGQRELLIGDRQTGKTSVAVDTILNQKGNDVLCIYVAVGQKMSKVAELARTLEEKGAMEYTTIVVAGAAEGPTYSYLAPYTGVAIAEYFMDKSKDVLVVYDDLSKHAVAYREISLLLRRPPGREAYPGDVFYLHSRLLERAARRNKEAGGGSITALPIIETQANDVSAYIPTNVISITDGQVYLESDLFNKGVRPAINVGLSVSRVGGAAQIKSMKKVAGTLKLQLAQYRELEAFSQFASDLDEATRETLNQGERVVEVLKQAQNEPIPVGAQVVIIFAATKGYLDKVALKNIQDWKAGLLDYLHVNHQDLLAELETSWGDEQEAAISKVLTEFNKTFVSNGVVNK